MRRHFAPHMTDDIANPVVLSKLLKQIIPDTWKSSQLWYGNWGTKEYEKPTTAAATLGTFLTKIRHNFAVEYRNWLDNKATWPLLTDQQKKIIADSIANQISQSKAWQYNGILLPPTLTHEISIIYIDTKQQLKEIKINPKDVEMDISQHDKIKSELVQSMTNINTLSTYIEGYKDSLEKVSVLGNKIITVLSEELNVTE